MILLLGSSGCVGQAFATELRRRGHSFISFLGAPASRRLGAMEPCSTRQPGQTTPKLLKARENNKSFFLIH
jgi:nucleoside-diphosphate-sugar epimerase